MQDMGKRVSVAEPDNSLSWDDPSQHASHEGSENSTGTTGYQVSSQQGQRGNNRGTEPRSEKEVNGGLSNRSKHRQPQGKFAKSAHEGPVASTCADAGRHISSEPDQDSSSSRAEQPPLVIVVGKGSRSHGSSVLKQLVENVLRDRGMPCSADPSNDGRLIVAGEDLAAYVELQRQDQHRSRYLQVARWQYLLVGAGFSALLSATYIVPLILEHAT